MGEVEATVCNSCRLIVLSFVSKIMGPVNQLLKKTGYSQSTCFCCPTFPRFRQADCQLSRPLRHFPDWMKETWRRGIVWCAIVGFIPFVCCWTHTHGISVAAKCLKFIMCHFSKLKKLEIKSQIQIYVLPSCTIYNGWQRFPQNALLTLFWQLISASSPFKPGLNSVNLPIFVHKNVTSLLHYYIFEDAQVNEASIWRYWANFLVQHDQSWIGSMKPIRFI